MPWIIETIEEDQKLRVINFVCVTDSEVGENDFFTSDDVVERISETLLRNVHTHLSVFVRKQDNKKLDHISDFYFLPVVIDQPQFLYLASFHVLGEYKYLYGIMSVDSHSDYDKVHFMNISKDVYDFLDNNYGGDLNHQNVRVPKDLGRVDSVDQLENVTKLTDEERFEIEKFRTIEKNRNLLLSRVSLIDLYNFFKFTVNNNRLLAEGIVITDENREEKYLEILRDTKSEDIDIKKKAERVVDILSDYLETMDYLSNTFKVVSVLDEFEESVNDCETNEELKKVIDKYERQFYG